MTFYVGSEILSSYSMILWVASFGEKIKSTLDWNPFSREDDFVIECINFSCLNLVWFRTYIKLCILLNACLMSHETEM